MSHPASLLPSVILALLLALPAYARWGETYAKCVERYGQPKKEVKGDAGEVKLAEFEVDDLVLSATFTAGKVSSLQYQHPDRSPLKAEAIVAILTLYEDAKTRFQPLIPFDPEADDAAGPEVHQQNIERSVKYQTWARSDSQLVAVWVRDSNSLLVYSPDLGEALKAAPKAGGKPKL
jgi:hypothetical protein